MCNSSLIMILLKSVSCPLPMQTSNAFIVAFGPLVTLLTISTYLVLHIFLEPPSPSLSPVPPFYKHAFMPDIYNFSLFIALISLEICHFFSCDIWHLFIIL